MRATLLLAAAAAAAAAKPHVDLSAPFDHLAVVAEVNSRPGLTWRAGINTRFLNVTLGHVKKLLGTKRHDPLKKLAKAKHSQWDLTELPLTALPASFDVRAAFPWAANITSVVRDQSSCGSCWAVSSTSGVNDRLAIARNYSTLLSTLDTTACCGGFDCLGSSGCDGGQPDEAWAWFVSKGVVTGGGFDSNNGCQPYPFEVCAHHVTEPGIPDCPTNEFPTPACVTQCSNSGYTVPYASDKHKISSSYNLNTVNAAMTDLVARGTFTVAFDVYQDFLTYTSGVYTCPSSGQPLGGHAVDVIGYGTEGGVDYWLVRNSWNSGWGDNGLFKIRRGTDECGIEEDMVAGTA